MAFFCQHHTFRSRLSAQGPAPALLKPPALSTMPGPHIEVKSMQCVPGIGGSDHWCGSYYTETTQWWVGCHSTKPLKIAHLTACRE